MIKKTIKAILKQKNDIWRVDDKIINQFIKNPHFPYLVSFPRTGSHWLRMIMELYFEKPSLKRIFYYKKSKDFTCCHDHDMKLQTKRKNVIYLYRNPVETIYSQMSYDKEDLDNTQKIQYWSSLYAKHLEKWLLRENFTKKKTVITYTGLADNIYAEFKKICNHFNTNFNQTKLNNVLKQVSKKNLKKKTEYNSRVINLSKNYYDKRELFAKQYSDIIFKEIYCQNPKLKIFFHCYQNNKNTNTKFSSITVTYNEEAHLEECLKALDFCDENIIIDLGSKDNSVKIAKKNKAKVFYHPRVDVVEEIREYAASLTSNNWVVFIDPDEIFPKDSINEINKMINSDPNIGIISFRRVNYFLGSPIKYGRWGGVACCPAILNKEAIIFKGLVHAGIRLKKGFQWKNIDNYTTEHYWIDSMEQFYEKHKRYLKYEGESRYKNDKRFSYIEMYISLIEMFLRCYIKKLGFLDKKNGWTLIKLALWYEKNAWLSLKKYEDEVKIKNIQK